MTHWDVLGYTGTFFSDFHWQVHYGSKLHLVPQVLYPAECLHVEDHQVVSVYQTEEQYHVLGRDSPSHGAIYRNTKDRIRM